VFGMGAPEVAPQASVKASAATIDSVNGAVIEHQGGDAVVVNTTSSRITFDGTPVTLGATMDTIDETRFEAGDSLYLIKENSIYFLDSAENTSGSNQDLKATSTTGVIKIVDVATQQMIADLEVRF